MTDVGQTTVIDLGRAADGTPGGGRFAIPAPGHGLVHVLSSGKTGSGKSSTAARIIGEIALFPNVGIVGFDFKGGLELFPWEKRFTWIAANHGEAPLFFEWLVDEVEARALVIRQFSKEKGVTYRQWEDWMGPRILMVVDEMAEANKVELEFLASIAARSRALGMNLLCSTQYALSSKFSSELLLNLSARICHRMGTQLQYATALASDPRELVDNGVRPISEEERGVCYVAGVPGMGQFVRCRADFVPDHAIDKRAGETAHLRWPTGDLFFAERPVSDGE